MRSSDVLICRGQCGLRSLVIFVGEESQPLASAHRGGRRFPRRQSASHSRNGACPMTRDGRARSADLRG